MKKLNEIMCGEALVGWLRGIEDCDDIALAHALDSQILLHSPVMNAPITGKKIALKYLLAARTVMVSDKFKYCGKWVDGTSAVLEFKTIIDDVEVHGVDILRWSEGTSRIGDIVVMIRPLSAIETVRRRMAELLMPKQ